MFYMLIIVTMINSPLGEMKETREIKFKTSQQCERVKRSVLTIKPTFKRIVKSVTCKKTGET